MALLDNILIYYHLDETSGTTATDSSGNANDGTSTDCTVNQAGRVGKAYSFNGSSSKLLPGTNSIGTNDSVTVCAWIKITTTGGLIFSRGSDNYAPGWSIYLDAYAGGVAAFAVVTTSLGAAQHTASGSTTLSAGTWYHVAGVWNAGVDVRFYLNGVHEATASTAATSLRTSAYGLGFGYFEQGPYYFDGLIDEGMVWNRALSASEVVQAMNLGLSRTQCVIIK